MNLNEYGIDQTWTLFLDRDGVINRKLENDYVKNWVDFEFIDDAIDAIRMLGKIFGHVIVVTNQQGIGKRLYTKEDLEVIHRNMVYEIQYHGGRIDKVYFSPHLQQENHPTRKPGIGMAVKAKEEHPAIDFRKSVIVGDSLSDMEFGRNAGMVTVFIAPARISDPRVDHCHTSLLEFAIALSA